MTQSLPDPLDEQTGRSRLGWSSLLDALPQGVILVDAQGGCVQGNPAAARILGLDREALPSAPEAAPWLAALTPGTQGCRKPVAWVRGDGGTRRLEVHAEPLPGGGALVSFDDVTAAAQVHEALQASEERYRDQFHLAGDGICIVTPDGRVLDLNESFARMHGYTREAALAMSLQEVATPAACQQAPERFHRILAGAALTCETEHVHRDGHILPLEVSASLVRSGGQPAILAFYRDITERKRLESALERRILALTRPVADGEQLSFCEIFSLADIQRLQDDIARATGMASIITRPDGTPLTRPSNFTRLCSELIRKSRKGCANCFKSDSTVGRYNPDGPIVQRCLSGGLWDAGASIVVGGHHIANWLIGQVRDEAQSPEAMAAYAEDIGVEVGAFLDAYYEVPPMSRERFEHAARALFTLASHLSDAAYQNLQQARFIAERNQAEAEIRRLHQGLEQRVKDRTLRLEAANRELEAFSYSVSHDLRAPLRSIDGFSQALLEDCQDQLDDTGRHYLARIRHGTRRMGLLIDDLLKLSRTHRAELTRADCDLSALCRKTLADLALSEPGRGAEVIVQAGMRVQADPRLLQVVLDNLLGNAWKFTSRIRKPRIEVAETVSSEGEPVFTLRDNGAGFDMALSDKLFSAFQRFHTEAEFEGTGIGLAIVQRVIHRHGGRIWAASEPGQGASFSFTLPAPGEALST